MDAGEALLKARDAVNEALDAFADTEENIVVLAHIDRMEQMIALAKKQLETK